MHLLSSDVKQSWLSWFLRGVLILVFLVLLAKLVEMQMIKGDYYRKLSEENRIRRVTIPAERGKILAKGGEVLAGNTTVTKRVLFTKEGGFTLSEDLTGATGEEMVVDYKRYYPLSDKFSQALGYLAKVGDEEAEKVNPDCPEKGVRSGEFLVGKTGLEGAYECLLSGTPGEKIIEVDASGKEVRILGKTDPIPGRNLQTTVDYSLQIKLADEMNGQKGAAIVTGGNGEILAYYSYPTFDPNIFVSEGNSEKITGLFNNPDLPFFNRVIGGTFHPGSVFKPLVALAALEEGVIDAEFTYNDEGYIRVNEYIYNNWYFTEYGNTEGSINLTRAIARSTDTFFYAIGQMVGPENIAKWAHSFGVDDRTGIDIAGEVSGLIPTPDWKKMVKNESWFLGNTYHMSIGQGDVAVTPIEINNYISAIATDGRLCTPHFYKSGDFQCKKINVKQQNIQLVTRGMIDACSSGGTAYTFFDFANKHNGIEVACKTGTAEVSTDGEPHAWFTFFAPAEDPQMIMTVLIEKGGQGSSVAGPVAREVADYYFASFGPENPQNVDMTGN